MATAEDIEAAKAAAKAAVISRNKEYQIGQYSTSHNVKFATQDDQLPPGAVRINKNTVLEVVNNTINNWQPSREMWLVRYGVQALGAFAGVSGFIFITHFRSAMLLRRHARFASLIPTVFFPTMVTTMSQYFYVLNPMISGDVHCPVCLQMRALTVQTLGGVVQPFILSIIASSALSRTANTYALPPVSDWRALMSTYARLSRPLYNTALSILILSAGSAVIISSLQGRAVNKVHKHITDHGIFLT